MTPTFCEISKFSPRKFAFENFCSRSEREKRAFFLGRIGHFSYIVRYTKWSNYFSMYIRTYIQVFYYYHFDREVENASLFSTQDHVRIQGLAVVTWEKKAHDGPTGTRTKDLSHTVRALWLLSYESRNNHCKTNRSFYGKITGKWLPAHLPLCFTGARRTFTGIIRRAGSLKEILSYYD